MGLFPIVAILQRPGLLSYEQRSSMIDVVIHFSYRLRRCGQFVELKGLFAGFQAPLGVRRIAPLGESHPACRIGDLIIVSKRVAPARVVHSHRCIAGGRYQCCRGPRILSRFVLSSHHFWFLPYMVRSPLWVAHCYHKVLLTSR